MGRSHFSGPIAGGYLVFVWCFDDIAAAEGVNVRSVVPCDLQVLEISLGAGAIAGGGVEYNPLAGGVVITPDGAPAFISNGVRLIIAEGSPVPTFAGVTVDGTFRVATQKSGSEAGKKAKGSVFDFSINSLGGTGTGEALSVVYTCRQSRWREDALVVGATGPHVVALEAND